MNAAPRWPDRHLAPAAAVERPQGQVLDRGQEDDEVEEERAVLDVVEVQALVGVEGRVVAGLDLPQAGDAGPHLVPVVEVGGELVDLVAQRRAGPDEAHVALQDVDQLGQLVEARAAQDVADPRDPGITGDLEQRAGALVVGLHGGQAGLGVDDHGAELEHPELGLVAADPLLAEQHRAAVLPLDRDGDDGEHRGGDEEQRAGDDDVEQALDGEGRDRGRGRLDVEEGFVGERRHRDPGGGDAGEPGVDDDLGAAVLLAGSARPGRAPERDGADGDAGDRRGVQDVVEVGDLAEPEVPDPGGLGLEAVPTTPTYCEPASGWISASRTISIARGRCRRRACAGRSDLGAVGGDPCAQTGPPDDEGDEPDDGDGGGGDQRRGPSRNRRSVSTLRRPSPQPCEQAGELKRADR